MQFLYPSEADTHRLLRFLLDRLSQTPIAAGRGRSAARKGRLGRIGVDDFGGSKINGIVRHALSVCWEEANTSGALDYGKDIRTGVQGSDSGLGAGLVSEPSHGDEKQLSGGIPFRTCPLRLSSVRSTNKKQPPLITIQAKPRTVLVPSVLELNSRSVEKSLRLADAQLTHLARQADRTTYPRPGAETKVISHGALLSSKEAVMSNDNVDSPLVVPREESPRPANVDEQNPSEASALQQQTEITKLEEQLATLTKQADKLTHDVSGVELKKLGLKKKVQESVQKADSLNQTCLLMEEAVNLALDDSRSPEAVLQELEVSVQEGDQLLLALQAEWEAVRSRLEERAAECETNADVKKSEIQNKLKRMREMRQELKEMGEKMWAREAEEAQLSAELEKVAKGATRATYVRRITELIRNSKKQDADIARIIRDTRELQREGNMSQEKLRRLYALVDETVFRDAKRDPVCRQAYRLLSSLHENFQDIVEKVLEIDKVGREISEMQVKLEDLEKRPLDKASVEADLEAIVAENRALERRLSEVIHAKNVQ